MLCLGRIITLLCCLVLICSVMLSVYYLTRLHPVVIISSPVLNVTLDPDIGGDDSTDQFDSAQKSQSQKLLFQSK